MIDVDQVANRSLTRREATSVHLKDLPVENRAAALDLFTKHRHVRAPSLLVGLVQSLGESAVRRTPSKTRVDLALRRAASRNVDEASVLALCPNGLEDLLDLPDILKLDIPMSRFPARRCFIRVFRNVGAVENGWPYERDLVILGEWALRTSDRI